MSAVLTAEPKAKFAECPGASVLEAPDCCTDQATLSGNDAMSEEFTSFQIRNFVSTVRRRDFSKCWPFRQKILEKCINVGLKPFLPPFQPPLSGCDDAEDDQDVSFSKVQQTSPLNARDEPCKACEQQDCIIFGRADIPILNKKPLSGDKEVVHDVIEHEFSDKGSVENHFTGTPLLDKPCVIDGRLSQTAGITDIESSQEGSGNDSGKFTNLVHSHTVPLSVEDRTVDSEKMECCMPSSVTNDGKDQNIFPSTKAGFDLMSTGPTLTDVYGISPLKAQPHHSAQSKSFSNECTTGEEQASPRKKAKSLEVGMAGKPHQEDSQLESETLDISDRATVLCNERDMPVGPPARGCRNPEDYTFTGLNFDILVPQVCPVCLNFTSTSNTALNAHIDHCLESVLPCEKGESRACKSRIKPRKMRSMADICATAPVRTLEDLERSSKLWALNDEASKEDSSCSLSWKSGLIPRQPRTSLHRAPAWKARTNLGIVDASQAPEYELPLQLEKSSKESPGAMECKLLWSVPRTHSMGTGLETEQSCEEQQGLVEEPVGNPDMAPSTKLRLARKKKEKQSAVVISSKEVLMSGGDDCLSEEEHDDHLWSKVPINVAEFTLIDTSAEEERRILQSIRCAKVRRIEAETFEQQGCANEFLGRSVNMIATSVSPSLNLMENLSWNETLRKRKHAQIDNNWSLDGSTVEDIALSVQLERPAKNRRAAPKIKSLLTVVANSRKDKDKDGFEHHDIQKNPSQWQVKTTDKGIIWAPSNLPIGHRDLNLKSKSSVSLAGDRPSEATNNHGQFGLSVQPSTPENLDSNNLSEHAKPTKGNFVSSGRALAEHGATCRDNAPTCCPQEEMPRHMCLKYSVANQKVALMLQAAHTDTEGSINIETVMADTDANGISAVEGLDRLASTSTNTKAVFGLPIPENLHMQMEVRRRLCEQLEVQRQLHLRIEAQHRYLQKIIEEQQRLGVNVKLRLALQGLDGTKLTDTCMDQILEANATCFRALHGVSKRKGPSGSHTIPNADASIPRADAREQNLTKGVVIANAKKGRPPLKTARLAYGLMEETEGELPDYNIVRVKEPGYPKYSRRLPE